MEAFTEPLASFILQKMLPTVGMRTLEIFKPYIAGNIYIFSFTVVSQLVEG